MSAIQVVNMSCCPKCGGNLQLFEVYDDEDKIVEVFVSCKRKYINKMKKGCGYKRDLKI